MQIHNEAAEKQRIDPKDHYIGGLGRRMTKYMAKDSHEKQPLNNIYCNSSLVVKTPTKTQVKAKWRVPWSRCFQCPTEALGNHPDKELLYANPFSNHAVSLYYRQA